MRRLTFAAICVLFLLPAALAQRPQPTPVPHTFVHDFAGVLSADGKAKLQAGARRLKDEYKTEIAIVTIDSLKGEDSFDYSMRMARSWGIGSKDNDVRGLLILVAVKDRKTAFRTSRHIEGELPDGVTGEISREMGAYFKKGDFNGGLSHGVDRILEREQAVYAPQPQPQTPARVESQAASSGGGPVWPWLLIPVGGAWAVMLYQLWRSRGRAKESVTTWPRVYSPHESTSNAKYRNDETPPSTLSQSSYSPSSFDSSSSSSYDYGSSSDFGSSSSYDAGSSGGDSGSDYSGGSDFGGGGSDSSW